MSEREERGSGHQSSETSSSENSSGSPENAKAGGAPQKKIPTSAKGVAGMAAKGAASKNAAVARSVQMAEKAVYAAKAVGLAAKNALLALKAMIATAKLWVPIVAAAVLVTTVVISTIAIYQTVGKNDNRSICMDETSAGSQVGSISQDATEREVAQEIGTFLMNEDFEAFGGPLSLEQTAGLVGNMIHESAGLRPWVRQSHANDTTLYSNSEVRSWRGGPSVGGRAIGLIQWDSQRADALVSFAEDRNSQWYDFETQMEWLRAEMNGEDGSGYEYGQIKRNSALTRDGESVEHYVHQFERTFFRAGKPQTASRIAAAIEFLEYFEAGQHRGTANASTPTCDSNASSNLQMTELAETAIEISWPWAERQKSYANCGFRKDGTPCGEEYAAPGHVEVTEHAYTIRPDPLKGLYASCDRFVASVVLATGSDDNFPWDSTRTQYSYLQGSDKWDSVNSGQQSMGQIDKGKLQPGDVMVTPGHIMMYVGSTDEGADMIAHASISSSLAGGGNGRTSHLEPWSSVQGWERRPYEVFRVK